jgi:hypothetical protein
MFKKTPYNPNMKYYSYSRFQLFDTCPYAYMLRYKQKVQGKVSKPLWVGRMLHEIAAFYDKHLVEKHLQTDITVLPELTKKVYYSTPHGLPPSAYVEIEEMVENLADMHICNPAITVGIEENIKVFPSPDITFQGNIDILEIDDVVANIGDYKSDWVLRTKKEVEKDFQLRVYSWLVLQEYPQIERFKTRLEFVRHGVIREVELSKDDILAVGDDINARIQQIESERKFEPRPGSGCVWCEYPELCTAIKNLGSVVITCPQDVDRIAQELVVLERQVSDRTDALKDWCALNGPVKFNGYEYAHRYSSTKKVADVKAFFDQLKQTGVADPFAMLNVDGRKAKKYYEDANFQHLVIDGGSTSFKGKKFKE